MRRYLYLLILLGLLTACGQPTQSVTLGEVSAATATSAAPTRTSPPSPDPAPTDSAAAPAPPTSAAVATPGSSATLPEPTLVPAPQPTPLAPPTALPLPAGMQQVTWNTVRFRYVAEHFAFMESSPYPRLVRADLPARATAWLVHTPDVCLNVYVGSDCLNEEISFALYPSEGLDLATWLDRTDPSMTWWRNRLFETNTVVAGQPALAWAGDGVAAAQTSYAVYLGDEILIINGVLDESFIANLQLVTPGTGLAVGDTVMTTQSTVLWTVPTGGEPVEERPELYPAALVTILAFDGEAAQVLTIDNVTGWVDAAALVLTSDIRLTEPQARFIPTTSGPVQAQVININAIPLRDRPRSTGQQLGEPVVPGEPLSVMGVYGDWLWLSVDNPNGEGRNGWMRWHYDGTQYIDSVQP